MQLIVSVKFTVLDPDGEERAIRKEIDLWPTLPAAVQTALTNLRTMLDTKVKGKYGVAAFVEGMRLES